MAYTFVAADREQLMLMPPSVADWLPEDHESPRVSWTRQGVQETRGDSIRLILYFLRDQDRGNIAEEAVADLVRV